MTPIRPDDYQDNYTQAAQLHDTAYRFLTAHGIPATPPYYTVAYAFAAARYDELNAQIQRQLARGAAIDNYFMLALFERYFLRDDLADLDHQVSDIHVILHRALHGMGVAADDLCTYQGLLEQHLGDLQQAPEAVDFKLILANLLGATRQTLDHSQRLRSNLEESRREIHKLQAELEQIREEAYTDALTGLYNRKALTRKLLQLSRPDGPAAHPLSVLMLDIDHFKRFNDTYGHLIGDEVIRRVAATLKQHSDARDIAARYGGEEFALVMPNSGIERAIATAETILAAVARLVLVRRQNQERLSGITLSVGVACLKPGESWDELLERADQALYQAKHHGRNRVISELQLSAGPA